MFFSKIFHSISLKYNLLIVLVFVSAGLSAQVNYRKNTRSCKQTVSSCNNVRPSARMSRKKKWTDADAAKAKKAKHELKNGDLLAYFQKDESPLILLTAENWYSGDTFRERHLFSWTSSRKDSVRYYAGRNKRAPLTFAGQRFAEAIIDFRSGKFSRFYISIFNAGDDTGVSYTAKTFIRMLDDMTEMITLHLRKAPDEGKQKLQKYENIRYYSWLLPYGELRLNWSSEKNKQGGASYCYIEFLPVVSDTVKNPGNVSANSLNRNKKNKKGTVSLSSITIKKKELVKKVKRDSNGAVIQDIPMVDQGPKGYCVPAVLERLFSYYGGNMNQHVLAGLMDTSAQGTNTVNMYTALKRISKKVDVNVRKHYEFLNTVSDLEKFVSKYNSLAKKEKAPRIKIARFGDRIDLERTFLTADPQIGRNALYQLKKRSFESEFCEFVREKIDAGIPVLWSVIMNFSPERGGGRGGHLRLITGYEITSGKPSNTRSRKKSSRKEFSVIIFSDTWGRGHEEKKMDASDAWAITKGLYYIEPDN